MPVRIYDISKKLGLENKEVLSKAKALGIAGARVASSSLDKITAEYLEQQIVLDHPHLAQASAPTPAVAPVAESIILVAPPPETETLQKQEPVTSTATAVLEPPPVEPSAEETQAPPVAEPLVEEPSAPPAPEPVAKAPPPPPPQPLGPKVGDKVGFIQLPSKPAPKPPERPPVMKAPARPITPARTDFNKRGDIRSVRGTT